MPHGSWVLLLGLALMAPAPASRAVASAGTAQSARQAAPRGEVQIVYRIERNGQAIGSHHVTLRQSEDGLYSVDIAFSIRVKFAFITAFKMDHRASEVWTADGALLDLRAVTERKSGRFDVHVSAAGKDGFRVTVNGETMPAPASLVPSSMTFAQRLFDGAVHRFVLLDTLSGGQKPSTIFYRGMEAVDIDGRAMAADYFEILLDKTNSITHRIWRAGDGSFLKLGLATKDGHYIEYIRTTLSRSPAAAVPS
ncbi:MAG: DUF6134 family protein [Pseudomonadota bacterium]